MVIQSIDMVAPKRVFKRDGRLEINPLLLQAFGITIEELAEIIKSSEEPEAMRDMFAFLSDYATLSDPKMRLFISGDKLDFMVADMRRRIARVANYYEYYAETSDDIKEEEIHLQLAYKAKQLSQPVGDRRTDKIAYIDAVMGFEHTSGFILPLAFGITDYGREDYWPRTLLAFLRIYKQPGKEGTMEYFISENITPDIENVLRRLKIEGNTVKITEQFDRKLYENVNKVLERLGGKWNRSVQAHIFPSDPTERINTVLTAGKLEPKVKTGYFPTPPEIARRMVEMLELKPGDKVLEPSAGQGGLLDQLPKGTQVIIGEILPENIQVLKQKGYIVNFDNFLGVEIGGITKVIMNPPFENQQDIEHVTHALRMLQPGGTLVSVMSGGIKFRDNKKTTGFIEMLDRDYYHEIIDLPEGSFRSSGTGVNAVLLKVTKPMSTPSTSEFVADTTKVSPELAARSHMGTSWDPEKRAQQEIEGFAQYVQEVYDNLKPYAKTESQKAFLDAEIKRFQDGFAKHYNALLARKGQTMSTFITGGSGFNVRRAEKANAAESSKYTEMIEFRDRAQAAILRELKKMGIEEAGGELEVLKKKIADAIRNHEFMVKTNAIVRKKIPDEQKIKEIQALAPISETTIRKVLTPDYMGRIGFPAYALSNDTANIHRMEERVKELEKKEATPTGEIPFTGGYILDNREQDRVQIIFDQRPSQAVIDRLKSEGWRWSPANVAWQRKRTDAAMYSAKRITGAVTPAPAVQPSAAPPYAAPEKGNIDKLIAIMEKYAGAGKTYEDFVAGLKGVYLSQSGYEKHGMLDIERLRIDRENAGYKSLTELWNDTSRKLRMRMYVPPKYPPMLYPAPESPRPAEEIMFVPNPETMTRDEYIKEKFRRMAQVLRQQGKPHIAALAEQATDPEWTSKFAASHRDQVVLALAQNKAVSPNVLKDYPDIVGNIRKVNEEILAKIKTDWEQIKAAERAEENMLNAELNKLPPALKRFAETEITGTLHLPETHKDYRNRFYIALGKVRRIAFEHQPKAEKQEVPVIAAPKVQTIQDVKQQVIQSIREAKDMGELKQILKGFGFLPLPEPDKRQLLDLYQVRFSELTFGVRITEEETKKRKAPRKVTYIPGTSRRLEEFGIKEGIRRYGYA